MSKDFQRQLCYEWERRQRWYRTRINSTPGDMAMPEIRRLVKRTMRAYRCEMPRVTAGRGGGSWGSSKKVIIGRSHRGNEAVVLHECAHSICDQRGHYDHHGPVFMRMFIELAAAHFKLDKGELLKSARGFGLKVAPWSALKKQVPL